MKDPAELVTRHLPAEDVERLLVAANQVVPEWYPLFLLLARTGLRISEAAGLQWGDVDLKLANSSSGEASTRGASKRRRLAASGSFRSSRRWSRP